MLGDALPVLPSLSIQFKQQEETHTEMHKLRFSVETETGRRVATVSNREAAKPGSAAQAGTRPREE